MQLTGRDILIEAYSVARVWDFVSARVRANVCTEKINNGFWGGGNENISGQFNGVNGELH